MTPGKYFVLTFDFSKVHRSPDLYKTNESLERNIAHSFEIFYSTYSKYLGNDMDKLFKNIEFADPSISLSKCVELVRNAISRARENGQEQIASIKGVSNNSPNYEFALIANP